jgi:hypothetical protein
VTSCIIPFARAFEVNRPGFVSVLKLIDRIRVRGVIERVYSKIIQLTDATLVEYGKTGINKWTNRLYVAAPRRASRPQFERS